MKDSDFLWKILPLLSTIKLEKSDVLYWKGDTSEEIYFLVQGTIKFYTELGHPYVRYSSGDMFGDSDALLDLPRDGKAVATTNLVLKALNIKHFDSFFANSQDTCFDMIVKARRKRDKHLALIERSD